MTTLVDTVTLRDLVLEIERPRDPESLISEEAFGNDEFLPYWAELWSSGRALASYLAGADLAGRHVLELGCGLGLPSLVAAARGTRVLATDWSSEAVALLEANARRNRLKLEARQVDWRDPGSLDVREFNLIVASDVLYEERNIEPLLALLSHALETGSEAWIADPGRRHAPAFLQAASDRFRIATVAHEAIPNGGIHLLRSVSSTG